MFQTELTSACGPNNGGLKATGYVNLGTVQVRGMQIAGQHHVADLAVTYGWSVELAVLQSADAVLQSNLILILGAQLPAVPLHEATLGFAYRHGEA